MSSSAAGLARITINAPKRRVDVAVPDAVPLAELLPELLQHAGNGLADDGERHGGWLLRRSDGTTLSAAAGLAGQGVHDGAVLHLVPARAGWPELEYDDVVEAIAAGARRQGLPWSPAATRATALSIAGAGFAVALLAIVRADMPLAAAAVAAGLVLAGIAASRAYGDAVVGSALAAFGLPFAAAGGWLAAPQPATPAGRSLLCAVALLLVSLVAAVGVAHLVRIFVAGMTVGMIGALGGLLATVTRPAAAAAIVLAVLAAGVAGLPLLAIRLGKLPMPVVALPGDLALGGRGPSGAVVPRGDLASGGRGPGGAFAPPGDLASGGRGSAGSVERARIFAAVARTDEMLTGMLLGLAIAGTAASVVLARSGDVSGGVLVAVAGTALLLRARTFLTVRQRLPLIVTGAVGFALVALFARVDAGIIAAAVPLAALIVAVAGARAAVRPASPYVGRAADLLDTLCVVAVIPLACAVVGLYGLFL
ncbi:type VII secretion integral membrane protein EccD [Dactylosporangium darangshiense]|uniref:Type VII secretion integral membrane protein EccD n=1 Tax=Dactylosporangium darangshiense TaxID=579108 RepID=A0ABP8D3U4_9ACTN